MGRLPGIYLSIQGKRTGAGAGLAYWCFLSLRLADFRVQIQGVDELQVAPRCNQRPEGGAVILEGR